MASNYDFQQVIMNSILKELEKESFKNEHNDICFLTQKEIDQAVWNGIQNVFKKISELNKG